MKFEEASDPHYARWLVSESGAFFIGVDDYLFGQKCIQVLFAGTAHLEHSAIGFKLSFLSLREDLDIEETRYRYVIREWRTYKPELAQALIKEIKHNLANVEAGFGDWGLVEKFLPEKRAKYLEDESIEEKS